MEKQKKYPIKVVAKMTGLTVHAIRMWEKRYKLVEPDRTASNRRLYSEQDIQRLRLLKQATDMGYGISQVAAMDSNELEQLVLALQQAPQRNQSDLSSPAIEANLQTSFQESLKAIQSLNAIQLENILLDAAVSFSQPVILENLILPLIQNVGVSWQNGVLRIYHEHLATSVIRKFLLDQLSAIRLPPSAPDMIVTTPAGQTHELGALIAALIAVTQGWNVTYLGASLPVEDIAAVIKEKNAQSLLLSLVYPLQDPKLEKELARLREIIGKEITIIVGGRAVNSYLPVLQSIDAIIYTDFSQLRKYLSTRETRDQ
jgi:DNA-binding transcriptional MerR regulator/methylmalonyl-CoA mutase cobalamin-binding subunit